MATGVISTAPCCLRLLNHGLHSRRSSSTATRTVSLAAKSRVLEPAQSQKLDNFGKWLTEANVQSLAKPADCGRMGLGLIIENSRQIKQGQEVLSVPEELWMSVSAARASPEIGPFCDGLRPWVALAVFLLHEKSKGSSSRWHPYIEILPDKLDSPLFWSNEELAQLEGTQLLGSILGYQQHVESEYQKLLEEVVLPNPQIFNQSVFTAEAFLWAFGILRSRTFSPLTGDDLALVPLADLVNHGMITNMEGSNWRKKTSGFFPRKEFLSLYASVAAKEGEQVLMQYGKQKSNGNFALDYGFVERSPGTTAVRESFMLTLEIPESDRFYFDKLDIAEINGLNSTVYFDLVLGQDLPVNMLPFLRLLALDGPDSFLLEALFRNSVWEHLQLPVSRENEQALCKVMLDGCRSALAGYSTTIDEDIDLLKSEQLDNRLEMAIVIRLGEKRVLEEIQLYFENQMSNLDQLEYYAERRLRSLGLLDEKGETIPWVFDG